MIASPGALRFRRTGLALLALLATAACGDSPTSATSLPASPVLTITGPASIAPGATAHYSAVVRAADGATSDVTAVADWFSARPGSVVDVGPGGVARGMSRGRSRILARHGTTIQSLNVVVTEDGTFELSGLVTDGETGQPLPDAVVEVEEGIGAGEHMTTDGRGAYALYGVAGDVRVRISAAGRTSRIVEIGVTDSTIRDVALTPIPPIADLSGHWMLTVSAPPGSCGLALPDPARTRQFLVSIEQTGSQLVLRPSGPTVAVAAKLKGRVFGSTVTTRIDYSDDDDFGDPSYQLLDQLEPGGLLGVWGVVEAVLDGHEIAGTLDGGFHYYQHGFGVSPVSFCNGRSALTLRRE